MAVALALVLIPLRLPPPSPGPGYQAFSSSFFGEVGVDLDPAKDHLLLSEDELVTVYVPVGAYEEGGRLVLQPRDVGMIPERVDEGAERVLAVDLLIVGEQGEIVEEPHFNQSLLLCFDTSGIQTESSMSIQRYEQGWNDLPTGPGWQLDQVCATLDHLSIIALTIQVVEPTATPPDAPKSQPTPTPELLDLYSPLDG
jgi:hypothetical protein